MKGIPSGDENQAFEEIRQAFSADDLLEHEMPTPEEMDPSARTQTVEQVLKSASRWRYLGFSTFLFALLQALCPAVIAISAVRVLIGVGALAAAAGTDAAPRGFHQDLIRIPMMFLALAGAILNLFVIWQIRRLRNRPAAQWRLQPVPKSKLRSERIQIALALLTFVLLAAEWITHPMIHHPPH